MPVIHGYPIIREMERAAKRRGINLIGAEFYAGSKFSFAAVDHGKFVGVVIRPAEDLAKGLLSRIADFVECGSPITVILIFGFKVYFKQCLKEEDVFEVFEASRSENGKELKLHSVEDAIETILGQEPIHG